MSTRLHGRASRRNWQSELRRSGSRHKDELRLAHIGKGESRPPSRGLLARNRRSFANETKNSKSETVEVARVGKREEMDFADEARTWAGIGSATSCLATATSSSPTVLRTATPLSRES